MKKLIQLELIDPNESLPPVYLEVLVYHKLHKDWWVCNYDKKKNKWEANDENGTYRKLENTMWCKLPEDI